MTVRLGPIPQRVLRLQQILGIWVVIVLSISIVSFPASDPLPSWEEGIAKTSIISFVEHVVDESHTSFVPRADRVAVFDNDGTLCAEKPTYFEVLCAYDMGNDWLPDHPQWENDAVLMDFLEDWRNPVNIHHSLDTIQSGSSCIEFRNGVLSWLAETRHPEIDLPFVGLAYQPQLELINYLIENEFSVYIVTASDVDFVRVFADRAYRSLSQHVIGVAHVLSYDESSSLTLRTNETLFPRNPSSKPKMIETYIGVVPILAFGNSDGDIPMLRYSTVDRPNSLGLVLRHDDPVREYEYGSESAVFDEALSRGWIVVSMKSDFKAIYSAGTVEIEEDYKGAVTMELRDILTIVALLLGPVSAALLALWLEARRRRHTQKEERKLEVLYDLVRSRAAFNTDRNREVLESALNAIPIIFHGDKLVTEAHREAFSLAGRPEFERALQDLVLAVCANLGYENVEASIISEIFLLPDTLRLM